MPPTNTIGPPPIKFTSSNVAKENCMGFALRLPPGTKELHKRTTFLQIENWPQVENEALARGGGSEQETFKAAGQKLIKYIINELSIPSFNGKASTDVPLIFMTEQSANKCWSTNPAIKACFPNIKPRFYQIAFMFALDLKHNGEGSDFHWASRVQDGTWQHKPGQSPVTNKDSDGKLVVDPKKAHFRVGGGADYKFCCYFWVLFPSVRKEMAKALKIKGYDDIVLIALDNAAYVKGNSILPVPGKS